MRKVNYIVKAVDGSEFTTTDYKVATTNGNRISKTFLTEIRNENPKVEKWNREHATRIQEVLSWKGSL